MSNETSSTLQRHRASPASSSSRRLGAPRALVLVGLLLALGLGIPLGGRFLRAAPKAQVTECRVTWLHGDRANVTLANGTALVFDQQDIPDPSKCIPVGTEVEKRSFEIGYWIGGIYHPLRAQSLLPMGAPCLVGFLLLVLGVFLSMRARVQRLAS